MPISPTKSNLLNARGELRLAQSSRELLDQKREVLLQELYRHAFELVEVRERLRKELERCFHLLGRARVRMGDDRMKMALSFRPATPPIEVIDHSVMGVRIPTFAVGEAGPQPMPGPEYTSADFDECHQGFRNLYPTLMEYAEKSIAVRKLATEVKKTRRQVNSLENVFIPEYEGIIRYIGAVLEQNEREEFFRQKHVKRRILG